MRKSMPAPRESKLRALIARVYGDEPPPPIGDYAEPPGEVDRRQFRAILISFVLVVVLAVLVTQFNVLGIHFREIPEDVLNPFSPMKEVATPTPAP